MLKKTSRYKLNKLISETPADNIQFALDVSNKSLNQVQTELKKIAATDSFTLIVIPNKSQRGIL
jgi:CRISPR/Cas system-associated endoribonuclease Cas2